MLESGLNQTWVEMSTEQTKQRQWKKPSKGQQKRFLNYDRCFSSNALRRRCSQLCIRYATLCILLVHFTLVVSTHRTCTERQSAKTLAEPLNTRNGSSREHACNIEWMNNIYFTFACFWSTMTGTLIVPSTADDYHREYKIKTRAGY